MFLICSGVNVKTRKRNIVVPSDPGSFATAIVQIFADTADGVNIDKDLEAAVKVLDSAELDFNRYADTLFEVLFAGGRLSTGGNLADDQKERLATCVSKDIKWVQGLQGCRHNKRFCRMQVLSVTDGTDTKAITPFINLFKSLMR